MKKIKLYFDTSVIGGYFDKEFEIETHFIFKDVIENKYSLSISDLTIRELIKAPDNVRNLLKDRQISHSILLVNDEVLGIFTEFKHVLGHINATYA